jgi:hypothetical protein
MDMPDMVVREEKGSIGCEDEEETVQLCFVASGLKAL